MDLRIYHSVFIAVLLLVTSACATQYKSSYWKGGYSEQQTTERGYKVTFQGNGYTSSTTVENYLLLRCAELTVKNGYKYFLIVGKDGDKSTNYNYDDLSESVYSVNKHTKTAQIYMANESDLTEDELKSAINAELYWKNNKVVE